MPTTGNAAKAPSPAPAAGGGSMRMFIMLPLLFGVGKLNLEENPALLNVFRVVFFSLQVVQLLLNLYLKNTIEKKKDMRKIVVPNAPKSPFEQAKAEDVTETTYFDYELTKCQEALKQVGIGAAISSFIHFKFGVNQVVVIQSAMIPLNLYENPLVKKYFFNGQKVWNETTAQELEEKTTTTTTARKSKTKKTAKDEDPAQLIVKMWDAELDADFDQLFQVLKSCPNVVSQPDCWTGLMIACGSPVDSENFIFDLIVKCQAKVLKQDQDGWTALHWAAFHGRPEAATMLLEATIEQGDVSIASLVEVKDKNGHTAVEVAKEEGNQEVVDVIEQFQNKDTAPSSSNTEGLRQRKPANDEKTTIEEVD